MVQIINYRFVHFTTKKKSFLRLTLILKVLNEPTANQLTFLPPNLTNGYAGHIETMNLVLSSQIS